MDEIKSIIRSFIICTLPTTKTGWVAQLLQWLNYGLDFSVFDSRQGQEILFYTKCPDQFWSPPSILFIGIGGYLFEIKRPERDVDHDYFPVVLRLSMSAPVSPTTSSPCMPSWCGQRQLYHHLPLKMLRAEFRVWR